MPTIPTAFMCQTPADIASALQLLAPLSTDERDDALTYLLFLSDADTIYNAALGMYGLLLALLVAQHSQRGPCKYLVSLGALKAIRSKKQEAPALQHRFPSSTAYAGHPRCLCKAYGADGSLWNEVVKFVNSNSLHRSTLRISADDKQRHSDICIEHGDHLANTSDWAQVAADYLLDNATQQVASAFVQAKEWHMAPVLAAALGSGFDT
ncbi:putative elongator complex protein 1 [Coemansia sp. RSA 1813]|nr:putative elongator complex protein 1 [Coemansia sp. RSA 1813]